MLHISDIKKYSKCPRYYFLSRMNPQNYFNFFRNDTNIVEIYKKIFNFSSCFIGKTGDNPELVLSELDNYDYFVNARFSYKDLRIKVSLLKKESTGYSLFFFKPILSKDLDLNSMFITLDVLKKNNISVMNIGLIYVNKDYVLENEIDYNDALTITNKFNNEEIIDLVSNHQYDYESIVNEIYKYDESLKNEVNINCSACEYFELCHSDKVTDDSILHLVSSKYKYDMYMDGILNLNNVDIDRIDGTSLQYAQIMASRNKGYFVDKKRIKEFLNNFDKKPISFIDFEWDSFLFPVYKGMKCFGILPFEFCLYTINSDKKESNYSYVGKGDCREEFINELINHLPKEGPIVAYNSFSAEVLRLNELAEQFPKYKIQLDSICKRFVDLAEIFSKGMLYDVRFKGQLSLKRIVSTISNISYSDFAVKDGLDAIKSFRKYELNNDEVIKKDLITYCNQDAYSMIVIYNYLNQLV